MKKLKTDSSLELARWIAQVLDRKGAQDITVLDTSQADSIADYLILANGTSQRHMETLLDSPCRELKQGGYPPLSVEGEDTQWVLADLGDVVLHIFDDSSRRHFDLEGLWNDAPRIPWETKSSSQSLRI